MIITHNGTILTNDGVVLNNITTSPSFPNTYSLEFDGVDDYIGIPSANTDLDFYGKHKISIAGWIKIKNLQNQH